MNKSREISRALLEKARGDHYVLVQMFDDEQAPTWILGFHAQQAIEKSLKAVLSAQSIEYPRTHNLAMLLELLRSRAVVKRSLRNAGD